jgi:hypothetical protein
MEGGEASDRAGASPFEHGLRDESQAFFATSDFKDTDFTVDGFRPGSGVSAELYRTLMKTQGEE